MPTITVIFRNKLSAEKFEQLLQGISDLIGEPVISVEYDATDESHYVYTRDLGKIKEKTEEGYILE